MPPVTDVAWTHRGCFCWNWDFRSDAVTVQIKKRIGREACCALKCAELDCRYKSDLARNESENHGSKSFATYKSNLALHTDNSMMISPSVIRTAPSFRLAAFPTSKAFLTATCYHNRQLSTSSLCRNFLSTKQSHQEATSPSKRGHFYWFLACLCSFHLVTLSFNSRGAFWFFFHPYFCTHKAWCG